MNHMESTSDIGTFISKLHNFLHYPSLYTLTVLSYYCSTNKQRATVNSVNSNIPNSVYYSFTTFPAGSNPPSDSATLATTGASLWLQGATPPSSFSVAFTAVFFHNEHLGDPLDYHMEPTHFVGPLNYVGSINIASFGSGDSVISLESVQDSRSCFLLQHLRCS